MQQSAHEDEIDATGSKGCCDNVDYAEQASVAMSTIVTARRKGNDDCQDKLEDIKDPDQLFSEIGDHDDAIAADHLEERPRILLPRVELDFRPEDLKNHRKMVLG